MPVSEPRESAVVVEPAGEREVAPPRREGKNYRAKGKTYTG